ncbi:MAG: hypothetical protein WCE98_06495 [Chlorobium sp.]
MNNLISCLERPQRKRSVHVHLPDRQGEPEEGDGGARADVQMSGSYPVRLKPGIVPAFFISVFQIGGQALGYVIACGVNPAWE